MVSEKHISNVGRQQVEESIKLKMAQLKIWSEIGIPWLSTPLGEKVRNKEGELQLDYFPFNVVKFCEWDASQNCEYVRAALPKILRTNRSGLNSTHNTLKLDIEQLLENLAGKAKQQLTEKNKADRIASLEDEVTFLKSVLEQQETEITQMRLKQIWLEKKLAEKERSLTNGSAHYEGIINLLEKQISELTSSLRKVIPLKIGQ